LLYKTVHATVIQSSGGGVRHTSGRFHLFESHRRPSNTLVITK